MKDIPALERGRQQAIEQRAEQASALRTANTEAKPVVLIADDEPRGREMLEALLTGGGYTFELQRMAPRHWRAQPR